MADRPRIASPEYADLNPRRVLVVRAILLGHPPWLRRPWWVYRSGQILSEHVTHAEAITAAHKLAHDTAPRVWTTPDSGSREDYGLIVG